MWWEGEQGGRLGWRGERRSVRHRQTVTLAEKTVAKENGTLEVIIF